MFITYDLNQREILPTGDAVEKREYVTFEKNGSAGRTRFKPRYLVKITDMSVVVGSEVQEQYWALSYAHSQSALIPQYTHGRYRRIAAYTHDIIGYPAGAPETFSATFYLLIQQICTDFGIRYLWFDHMCIQPNGDDDSVRHRRERHMIYSHALCTIALIPELKLQKGSGNSYVKMIVNSEWNKGAWTLAEAYNSQNILFLGQDVHLWTRSSHTQAATCDSGSEYLLRNIAYQSFKDWCASTTLWSARQRASSQPHDRIYALINIHPRLNKYFTFDYTENIYDLTLRFYQLLALGDPSVLLFGRPVDDKAVYEKKADDDCQMEQALPSWTGVRGIHIPQVMARSAIQKHGFPAVAFGERILQVRSACVEAYLDKRIDYNNIREGYPRKPVNLGLDPLNFVDVKELPDGYKRGQLFGLKPTHFLPAVEKEFECVNDLFAPTFVVGYLSLTQAHSSSRCFILSEFCFPLEEAWLAYPVVQSSDNYAIYKSVGVCLLHKFQLYPDKQNTRLFNIE